MGGLDVISAFTRTIKDNIATIQTEQRTLAASEKQREIRHWLSSPDPSSNHNITRKARQATTGE